MLGKVIDDGGGEVDPTPALPIVCTPENLELPDYEIPSAGFYDYSYRINGGNIINSKENAGGNNAQLIFQNILGHYGLFDDLVANKTGTQAAFLATYDSTVIRAGSMDNENAVKAQQNTIEFLITPNSTNDLIQLVFGENITLTSCAIVNW